MAINYYTLEQDHFNDFVDGLECRALFTVEKIDADEECGIEAGYTLTINHVYINDGVEPWVELTHILDSGIIDNIRYECEVRYNKEQRL